MSEPRPKPVDSPRPLVSRFVGDPLIRIMGFLLIVAAAVLLYLNPEYHLTPRWRGGPIPSDWQPRTVADRLTLPLPPDLHEIHSTDTPWEYAAETLSLRAFVGEDAFPVRRDASTMDEFRATSLHIAEQPARMATWTTTGANHPYQLGVSFQEVSLTLVFTTSDEDTLSPTKSAIHAIQWTSPSTPSEG